MAISSQERDNIVREGAAASPGLLRRGIRLEYATLAWNVVGAVVVFIADAYLAGAVLAGLLCNAIFGWWWADPLAGLVIVYYAVPEARMAFGEATG